MKKQFSLLTAIYSLTILGSAFAATPFIVTNPSDTSGTGSPGSLRHAINNINQGIGTYNSIEFALPPGQEKITLTGILPLLNVGQVRRNISINGANSGGSGKMVTIDGNNSYPGFFVNYGIAQLSNLTIQNTYAKGGNGGSGGGGGGLGAGAGLFIKDAFVNLSNINFYNCNAAGGNGAPRYLNNGGGGGGTMGGNGGPGSYQAGGGGGGMGGHGGNARSDFKYRQGGGGGGGLAPNAYGGTGAGFQGGGYASATSGLKGDYYGNHFRTYQAGYGGNYGLLSGPPGGNYGGGGGGGAYYAGGGGGGVYGANGGNYSVNGAFGGAGRNFGGGGGAAGSGSLSYGGAGGFMGGAGGSASGDGGYGGLFGGGGGGYTKGGDTLFGGGGGGSINGLQGVGGAGGCDADSGNGGAGGAMGAAIFINFARSNSAISITGPLTIKNCQVTPGEGPLTNLSAAVSEGIFGFTGNNIVSEIIFNPNLGEVITINNSIGDDNVQTLKTGQSYNQGFGTGISLGKLGGGTLILNAANTYAGKTVVDFGTLLVNGSIMSFTQVQHFGILGGSGTIIGDVEIYGKISPGNSIGVLTIVGNYLQHDTSVYLLEVDETQSDLVTISGTANLDGTVAVEVLGAIDLFHKYTILHADGGVTGTYSGATSISPFIATELSYDPNNVYLLFRSNFIIGAVTSNQLCIASTLDSIMNPTADVQVVLNELFDISSIGGLELALDAISGEQYTYLQQVNRYGNERFNRRIYNALRPVLSPCCFDCYDIDCACSMIQTWFEIESGQAFAQRDQYSAGLDSVNVDYSIGAFTMLSNNFLVGAAVNYQTDFLRFKQGGRTDWNTAQGAIYAAYQDQCMYAFGDVIVGGSWGSFKRDISFSTLDRTAKSKPRTEQGLMYVEAGANLHLCNILIQPFVGYECGLYRQSKITESGSDALDLLICGKSIATNDSYLGAHFTACCDCLTVNADLVWQHRFNRTFVTNSISFQDFGTPCNIRGVDIGSDGIRGAVNLSTCICDGVNLYATFTGEDWKNWWSYGVDIGLNISW